MFISPSSHPYNVVVYFLDPNFWFNFKAVNFRCFASKIAFDTEPFNVVVKKISENHDLYFENCDARRQGF